MFLSVYGAHTCSPASQMMKLNKRTPQRLKLVLIYVSKTTRPSLFMTFSNNSFFWAQKKNECKMKKVNKQCLLDTPRTVRFSEKTLRVIVQTSRPKFLKKILVESVQTKIINSFMHMFNVSTLYPQIIKLLHQKLW